MLVYVIGKLMPVYTVEVEWFMQLQPQHDDHMRAGMSQVGV